MPFRVPSTRTPPEADPPDGVLLWRCYLSTDQSRSVYPKAQIRQGADRISAQPAEGPPSGGSGLATTREGPWIMTKTILVEAVTRKSAVQKMTGLLEE